MVVVSAAAKTMVAVAMAKVVVEVTRAAKEAKAVAEAKVAVAAKAVTVAELLCLLLKWADRPAKPHTPRV
jgi:hypothetical protein